MTNALQIALVLTLPLVCAVAVIGVVCSVIQTIFQVQDQNVAFLPKLLGVAFILTVGGPSAVVLLVRLFRTMALGALQVSGH